MSLRNRHGLYIVTPPRESEKATSRVFVADMGDVPAPTLETVDALARLQMVAKRLGVILLVRTDGDALRRLIRLAGLDEVLMCVGSLELEGIRQPEPLEKAGVEEVVDVEDPPA
jgi:hypothetical protein